MKKLLFDMRCTHKTGVYRYGLGLLRKIIEKKLDLDIVCYDDQIDDIKTEILDYKIKIFLVDRKNTFFINYNEILNKLDLSEYNYHICINYIVDTSIHLPKIVVIHDLIRIKFPEYSYTLKSFLDKFGQEEYDKLISCYNSIPVTMRIKENVFLSVFLYLLSLTIKDARYIICCSNYSKLEIGSYFPGSLEKIKVLYPNISSEYYQRSFIEAENTLKKYNLYGDYCLYVGLTHPHKRLNFILKAFDNISKNISVESKLVLVGRYCEIKKMIQSLDIKESTQNRIIILEDLTNFELSCLYSFAKALCVASICEGYCMPIKEALSCNCRVIASDIDVFLFEFGYDLNYFDKNQISSLARKMQDAFEE